MRFWQAMTMEPLDERAALCQAAEAAGYTGVTFGEHLVTPAYVKSRYPYAPHGRVPWDPEALFPDPWQVISALSAVTTTLQFMTAIFVLPLRDVFTAAKAVSTAAVLSHNRITFGVGVGWMREEFRLTGQSFEERGARADEMIEIIQGLLRGGMFEYHGRFHDFEPVQISPVPTNPVPIIVGGETPAALRRAARADGWITSPRTPADVAPMISQFEAERTRIGAGDKPSRIVALLKGDIAIDRCQRLADAGVTDVVFPSLVTHPTIDPTSTGRISLIHGRAARVIARMA
ncbi:TIGR03619 family F420-dependent LLM class oxidoreductase [Pseudofrankia asymbiotica]|uniref:Luciferase-like domain-containing protein n=1 Tax=Pseudofrankia asymbiotica TaxID=1834516 RepID=A0A1V2I0Q7_9ACTN|nr:TIGR03619 family F420-dependent LLM class oxidoreductase [Pseudofrankia asymbiotica]ONH22836.1 hypothetical protein BL253_34575 [Pseudofrankia asymbiotica]